MKSLMRMILLLSWTCLVPSLYAGEAELKQAFQRLESMHGFEADPELKALIPAFQNLPLEPDTPTIRKLFEEQNIGQWSARLADFLGLVDILFESMDPDEQKTRRDEFLNARSTLLAFQKDITRYVRAIHPGFSGLGLEPLQKQGKGQGIRIVVFDVFESAQWEAQRQRYPEATIETPRVFGRPVELSHGNTVIDIILQLAPRAHIIPVAADAKSYAVAMQYVASQPAVDIVNMSRAFPEDPRSKSVDKAFEEALRRFTKQGLFVKSLGNTGSDLVGQLIRPRVEKGLGPVSTLTAYDLKLIRELYQNDASIGLEILALNLALFADELALTATIPGDHPIVQERTLAVPAEGIFSPSTDTFESGSSFAAPQITAWLALLLEQRRAQHPEETPATSRAAVHAAILAKADRKGHPATEWGRGQPAL